jgi:D-arabinose 1-dehydrogenase-like Zn-dependent alcohol dehydrogenase
MSKMYPMIVGHEIVGKVVKAGPKATGFKEGDLVGIGAQCDSCLECSSCKTGEW